MYKLTQNIQIKKTKYVKGKSTNVFIFIFIHFLVLLLVDRPSRAPREILRIIV